MTLGPPSSVTLLALAILWILPMSVKTSPLQCSAHAVGVCKRPKMASVVK